MEKDHRGARNGPHFIDAILAIALGILAVIVLGLTANVIHTFQNTGDDGLGAPVWTLLCCIYTLIVVAYILATKLLGGRLYHHIVHLALLGVGIVFWLAAWASYAAWATRWHFLSYDNIFGSDYYFSTRTVWQCGAAAAGLGALIFLLFIAAFALAALNFLRGRKNNTVAGPASTQAQPGGVYQQSGPGHNNQYEMQGGVGQGPQLDKHGNHLPQDQAVHQHPPYPQDSYPQDQTYPQQPAYLPHGAPAQQ